MNVGMLVIIGRNGGTAEQTIGQVVNLTRDRRGKITYHIKTLEERGTNKKHKIGQMWNVHRSVIHDYSEESYTIGVFPPKAALFSMIKKRREIIAKHKIKDEAWKSYLPDDTSGIWQIEHGEDPSYVVEVLRINKKTFTCMVYNRSKVGYLHRNGFTHKLNGALMSRLTKSEYKLNYEGSEAEMQK